MLTTAESLTLVTIKTGGSDFYAGQEPFKKEAIQKMGRKVEATYLLSGHIDATQTPWEVRFDLEGLNDDAAQHSLVGTIQPANAGADLLEMSRRLQSSCSKRLASTARCVRLIIVFRWAIASTSIWTASVNP